MRDYTGVGFASSKLKKIIKVLIYLVIAVAIVVSAFFVIQKVRALPDTILSFSPATRIVARDQDFILDAMIDPHSNRATVIELYVTFDQTKFRLDSIGTGSAIGSPFTTSLGGPTINNDNGTAYVGVGVPLTSPPSPVTGAAKVATFSFHSLSTASAVINSSIVFTSSSEAWGLDDGSLNIVTTRNPALITIDTTAPAGGSINYTNGYFTATSIALAASDGTDAVSGVNTASRIMQRRSATLAGTICGAYGAWGAISPTGTYPNFIDSTAMNGNCYQYRYLVSDNVGNQATYTGANTAKVDTAAPMLAQVTAVSSPTNDNTPNYTFSSTEAGIITYGGDCGSPTTAAIAGNNTITFNALSGGAHSNCTIRVTDAAGNQSSLLNVNSFTVDATVPTITSVAPAANANINSVTSANGGSDVSYTLSEAIQSGSIVFTRTGGTADAASPHTCMFNGTARNSGAHANLNLADTANGCTAAQALVSGTVYTMAINATDLAGNTAAQISNTGITFDTAAPTLAQVTAVPSPTNDTTPNYSFSLTEAGTITYGGDCSSTTTAAVSGNNAITFNALSIGTHSNCAITVTDSLGNASSSLIVNSFAITYPADFNFDRQVSGADFNILAQNFGQTNVCGNPADATKDCKVNGADFNSLATDFGKSF